MCLGTYASTGAEVADLTLTGAETTFVNDVVVAGGSAWFTDSMQPQLYRVPLTGSGPGAVETVPIAGPAADFVDGRLHETAYPLVRVMPADLGKKANGKHTGEKQDNGDMKPDDQDKGKGPRQRP